MLEPNVVAAELPEGAPPGGGYLADPIRKALSDRLTRLEGHLRAVRGMIAERRCADEILLQISAVKAALNAVAAKLLEHELEACMKSCMEGDPEERLARVTQVLATLLKQS